MNTAILKILLNRDTYNTYIDYINTNDVDKYSKYILNIIKDMYDTSNVVTIHETSIIDELPVAYPNLREDDLDKIVSILNDMESTPIEEGTVSRIIKHLLTQNFASKIATTAFEVLNEPARGLDSIRELIADYDNVRALGEEEDIDVFELTADSLSYENSGVEWFHPLVTQALDYMSSETLGLLFAVPNAGKTAMAITICNHFARQADVDRPVLYINNEQSKRKMGYRVWSNYFNRPESAIKANLQAAEDAWKRSGMDKKFIFIDKTSLSMSGLRDKLMRYRPSFVLIDQASKLKTKKADRQDLELGSIFCELRELVKEFDTHILGIHQGAVGSIPKDKKWLDLGDVFGSKTALQGEVDYMIGIASDPLEECVRYLSFPKNKQTGDEGFRIIATLNKELSKYEID